ncbi:MAG TPA: hypothetical protein VN283_04360 [Thiobacillus sp.]|nr:hypothetical protein [Thiobacillus sp.]
MTNVNPSSSSPTRASSGDPTVTRQVSFSLRAFDHLKQTQRKLKAEQGINLSNNQVLDLILDQHAQQAPAAGHVSNHTKGAHHAE